MSKRGLFLVAALLLVGCASVPERETASTPLPLYDPDNDMDAFDKLQRTSRLKLMGDLQPLRANLIKLEEQGWDMTCARQVGIELDWLIDYTAQFPRAELRLKTLTELIFAANANTKPEEQNPKTGEWGHCYTEWFWRMVESSDHLLEMRETGELPKVPPKFLDQINSPSKLRAYLNSLLISNIAKDGTNRRRELNESVSALTRLILRQTPANYPYHPKLKDALLEFLDNRWQNPETGFWGAWYMQGNKLIKTNDLSITFHIVSYRKGKVKHLDKIVRTLLLMKEMPYPYGWREYNGAMTNHHNYDVVRLLRYGWRFLTAAEKEAARKELRTMLYWCLTRSYQNDGTFKISSSDDALGDSFYFGVAFLNEIGFFHYKERFWTTEIFKGSDAVRTAIRGKLIQMGDQDYMIKNALQTLNESYHLKKGEKLEPLTKMPDAPVFTAPEGITPPDDPVAAPEEESAGESSSDQDKAKERAPESQSSETPEATPEPTPDPYEDY